MSLSGTGSVVKKARAKGVKAESLKLPPITAFATGIIYTVWHCTYLVYGSMMGKVFRPLASV